MREANITYAPDTSEEYPWNVGLYDTETADPSDPFGYVKSVGAIDAAEAESIADAWVNHGWDGHALAARFEGP